MRGQDFSVRPQLERLLELGLISIRSMGPQIVHSMKSLFHDEHVEMMRRLNALIPGYTSNSKEVTEEKQEGEDEAYSKLVLAQNYRFFTLSLSMKGIEFEENTQKQTEVSRQGHTHEIYGVLWKNVKKRCDMLERLERYVKESHGPYDQRYRQCKERMDESNRQLSRYPIGCQIGGAISVTVDDILSGADTEVVRAFHFFRDDAVKSEWYSSFDYCSTRM